MVPDDADAWLPGNGPAQQRLLAVPGEWIGAGDPAPAVEIVDDGLALPARLVGGDGSLFALRMRGHSMTGAAIREGDMVVVRRQDVAADGDIVAALVDGEPAVATFRCRDGHTELVPRNPHFEAVSADGATILGKVVCVIRRL